MTYSLNQLVSKVEQLILSDTINQRYRYNIQGKTPTQIQQELRKDVKEYIDKLKS